MPEFHNPYHFLPIDEPPRDDDQLRRLRDPDAARFRAEGPRGRLEHSAYRGWSGRIICRLVTETPLVVGGEQQASGSDYTLVEPYRFGGEPAIPATSLKGMLTALAEGASQSAMRVLAATTPVSYRQPMTKALSALGRIEKDPTTGDLRLRPLTAPTFVFSEQNRDDDHYRKWRRLFTDRLPLKMLFGEYEDRGEPVGGFDPARFLDTFDLHKLDDEPFPSQRDHFYMRAQEEVAVGEDEILPDDVHYHERWDRRGERQICTLFGQRPTDDQGQPTSRPEVRTAAYQEAHGAAGDGFVRGHVRVLGGWRRDMADRKKHEVFIPCGEAAGGRDTLPIRQEAIDAFKTLANEVTDEQQKKAEREKRALDARERLPYLPFDIEPEEARDRDDKHHVTLRDGHLVYFDVVETAGGFEVSAVSFSSIWRGLVRKGDGIASLRDFVPEELRPFSEARDTISPAEWLFGFVEEGREPDRARPYNAYAGRVRFGLGRLGDPAEAAAPGFWVRGEAPPLASLGDEDRARAVRVGDRVRLTTLGSPKPPSPQLYMVDRHQPGREIAKEALSLERHRAQGRKVYLHQDPAGSPWRTGLAFGTPDEPKQAKLRNAVTPIAAGRSFWFHLDFDNLDDAEVQLLCFALRPSAHFWHKLGMGKGLGLGSVRIEPQAILVVDREARYRQATDLFRAPRWQAVSLSPGVDPAAWPVRLYGREKAAAEAMPAGGLPTVEAIAETWRAGLERCYPAVLKALLLTGEGRAHQSVPVHPPQTTDQATGAASPELDTFGWFAINAERFRRREGEAPQQLQPITATTTGLPRLRTNVKPPRAPGGQQRAPRPRR